MSNRRRLWRPGSVFTPLFSRVVPIQWEQWGVANECVKREVGSVASVGAHPDVGQKFEALPAGVVRIVRINCEGLLFTFEQCGTARLNTMRRAGQAAMLAGTRMADYLPEEIVEFFSRVIHAFWVLNHELNLATLIETKARDTRYCWGLGGEIEMKDRKLLRAMALSHCVTLARMSDRDFEMLKRGCLRQSK